MGMPWLETLHSQMQTWEPWRGVLPPEVLSAFLAQGQVVRYRLGQELLLFDRPLTHLAWVISGTVRWLGTQPPLDTPITLQLGGEGSALGLAVWVSGTPCEWVVAKEETVVWQLQVTAWEEWVEHYPALAAPYQYRCSIPEAYQVLAADPPLQEESLLVWAQQAPTQAKVVIQAQLPQDETIVSSQADQDAGWVFLPPGGKLPNRLPHPPHRIGWPWCPMPKH